MNVYRGKSTKEFYLASLLYDSIDDCNFSAVKFLLCEKGADSNIILPTKTISPFHLVIGSEDGIFALNVTRLILQNGGNPNVSSDDGLTPVHIAAAWGRLEILQILLSCGGDPEFRDSNWMTPIHYAKKENHPNCLDLLNSYLPVKYDVLYEEKEDCCQYKLDKLIVDNGYATGEYELCDKIDHSINPTKIIIETLADLPVPDTTKYVLKWFDTHIDDRGGETFIKNVSSVEDMSEDGRTLPYESSIDESENENNKNKNITFRKSYKKKMKVRHKTYSSIVGYGGKIIEELDKNIAVSSGFDSGESETKNLVKRVSSESGILTLPNSKESRASKQAEININNFNFTHLQPKNVNSKVYLTCHESNYLGSGNSVLNGLSNTNRNDLDFKNVDVDPKQLENSSDYMTCSASSLLNKNIFAISLDSNLYTSDESCVDNNKIIGCDSTIDDRASTELSFVTVSEIYKYEDKDEGIVLYEKRMLKASSDYNGSIKTLSSKMSSLPETIDYDVDTLRRELTLLGFPPGPITATTKRVYIKKLHRLRKQPLPVATRKPEIAIRKVYSPELEKTRNDSKWTADLTPYRQLEDIVVKEFSVPSPARKWREGNSKSSFTYLLLDPRKTYNLPSRADAMDPKEVWEIFLSGIFYVGKGKKTRPYSHLYEAVTLWKQNTTTTASEKLRTILDIWHNGAGVICLHIFQNVIPVEAYTREAAMISALKMENISNVKGGEFYGVASTWQSKQKRMFGTFLLYKAMMVFLHEGERQLYAVDIATA